MKDETAVKKRIAVVFDALPFFYRQGKNTADGLQGRDHCFGNPPRILSASP
ncbi:MAG: hypothetical protein IJ060_05565 [Oscillospiraceae bacterium]|nr:hypothetical protein [Oscillospiraceae bacterium]